MCQTIRNSVLGRIKLRIIIRFEILTLKKGYLCPMIKIFYSLVIYFAALVIALSKVVRAVVTLALSGLEADSSLVTVAASASMAL
ncbi:hypothetical protein Syn7502_01693 [Synechococcus sp. PCC 7502]|nr:hypothetical protein Syn7502_01693 [Synechococcus sp. PCC 7502]